MVALEFPLTIQVASIGVPDTLFLMLMALVVFGPRRLPEIGRQIGKLMYEFRKVSNDFKFQMEEELRASEEADRQRKLQAAAQVTPLAAPEPTQSAMLEAGAGTTVIDPTYSAALAAEEAAGKAVESASASSETVVPSIEGEVRGEPRQVPQILPPASGEPVAAQKPFRGRLAEPPTESSEATPQTVEPQTVLDSGLSNGTEQEAHHA